MSNAAEVTTYLEHVEQAYRAGNATEHTYRPYLKELFERLVPTITAVNEPKRISCGAPDYAITRVESSGPRTIGYVEAKDIGVPLDEILRTDQLRRYLGALDNLVLTDYLEFRWFVRPEGQTEVRSAARIATVGHNRRLERDPAGLARVADMLVAMVDVKPPEITSPKELAQRMARMTHMIRNVALGTLRSTDVEAKAARDALEELRAAFKKELIPELTDDAFADMFAQTLAYGLFAARCNHNGPQPFNRRIAALEIPRANPFLRRLFSTIESPDLDDAPHIGFVDDLASLLADANMDTILRDFGTRTRTQDPIIHFYETFLAAYDPKLRELRGVYYTPEPVVTYIVRSVDTLLKRDFALPDGLASDRMSTDPTRDRLPLTILDPACGTGTFLYATVNHIRDRFRDRGDAGAWPSYVRERLLPRMFGFELLMAPYAVSHLKLGMQLAALDLPVAERERWAVRTTGDERIGVYLANTLEAAIQHTEHLFRGQFISDEANAAARVKREAPVMVVMGNPPYSGHSANNSPWVASLLRGEDRTDNQGETLLDSGKGVPTANYFMVDGAPLGERNPKWLNDDYVKFIRFGQWRIERTGYGVLAFVTNHGYLDNPTFRGMRQSLMSAFDDIYVLNLHGNSKKKERTPSGGKDENVFDIQQGVAIGLFIRRPSHMTGERRARVFHADLWGERAGKYDWLTEHDIANTQWTEVTPQSPFYLFGPRDSRYEAEYASAWSISDMLPVNGWGVATRKDYLLVDFSNQVLSQRFKDIVNLDAQAAIDKYGIQASPHWDFAAAKRLLSADVAAHVRSVLFRPFDTRYVYYERPMIERGDHRYELMRHMFEKNLCLITVRRTEVDAEPGHFFCSNDISVLHSTSSKEGNFVFPLYIYPDPAKPNLWDAGQPSSAPGERHTNLAPGFVAELAGRLGLRWIPDGKGDRVTTVGPEDVFSYTYAIFYAPSYRERYVDFLKSDFPRVPLTHNLVLFRTLVGLGDRLVKLHLLETKAECPLPVYPVQGNDRVDAVQYVEPDVARSLHGRVYINHDQYFDGIAPDVWEFHIGGYQVAEKWLKDRKGRTLDYNDIEHY